MQPRGDIFGIYRSSTQSGSGEHKRTPPSWMVAPELVKPPIWMVAPLIFMPDFPEDRAPFIVP